MIKTKILLGSINPDGQRITSYLLTYPRYIHAELMTHRALARNAASSRAIPIKRMIEDVTSNPVIPVQWGKNQKGMQSMELLNADEAKVAEKIWRGILGEALVGCELLSNAQVHKQWANRVIEPWMHITVLVTVTEDGNFFNLRAHPAALPDFQVLAFRMLSRRATYEYQPVAWGDWHVPYGDAAGQDVPHDIEGKLKVATARAARLSYLNFDGTFSKESDFGLHDGLRGNGHWSPFEHTARAEPEKPDEWEDVQAFVNAGAEQLLSFGNERISEKKKLLLESLQTNYRRDQGPFKGWTPYRKLFPGENQAELNIEELMAKKPDWITLEED